VKVVLLAAVQLGNTVFSLIVFLTNYAFLHPEVFLNGFKFLITYFIQNSISEAYLAGYVSFGLCSDFTSLVGSLLVRSDDNDKHHDQVHQ